MGSSSAAIADIVTAFARHGQVLAPDLPGHGASDPLTADPPLRFLDVCAESIERLCADTDFLAVNVLAFGDAATIALHAASALPDLIKDVTLVDPLAGDTALSMTPTLDGTHLVALWHELRNRELHDPPAQLSATTMLDGRLELHPEQVNRRLIDVLQSRTTYDAARADIDQHSAVDAAAACAVPVKIARTRDTAASHRSRNRFPDGSVAAVELPPEAERWAPLLSAE